MTEVQFALAQWVSSVSGWLPLGYSFGAGMVAAVNPCGFALLPVYLSLYVGAGVGPGEERPVVGRAGEALLLAGMVTIGFVLLFGVTGVIVSLAGQLLIELVPWIAVVLGVAMAGLGVWLLAGGSVSVPFISYLEARVLDRIDAPRPGERAKPAPLLFLLFGIGYGVASLSCTLPIFLLVVGSALAAGGLGNGVLQFLSYALGMGLVIAVLTLSVALFKGALVTHLRRALPHVQTVSALLLIGAGGYLVFYWVSSGALVS